MPTNQSSRSRRRCTPTACRRARRRTAQPGRSAHRSRAVAVRTSRSRSAPARPALHQAAPPHPRPICRTRPATMSRRTQPTRQRRPSAEDEATTSAANNAASSVAPVSATPIGRAHFDVLPAIKNTNVASNIAAQDRSDTPHQPQAHGHDDAHPRPTRTHDARFFEWCRTVTDMPSPGARTSAAQ